MKKAAVTLSSLAVTLTLLVVPVTPSSFAQSAGRGGGIGGGGGIAPGGAVGSGGGRGGGFSGGHRQSFGGGHPQHFRHRPFIGHRHFHPKFFGFGLGASAFYPAWWWYSPYYYLNPPPAYYTGYYGYPYNDRYYDYESQYWSDPCLSSDPAYAAYCPPSSYPYEGEYGGPPVDYPAPAGPDQPEGVSGSASPAPTEQPTSTGGER